MLPCAICGYPAGDHCARSIEAHERLQRARTEILLRHGIQPISIPLGGLHQQWRTEPELDSLFLFLARISDPHALPEGML